MTRLQRTVFGVFAVVFVSLLFGVSDERLTRLSGTLGQLANSPIAWGVWPCVVGLAIGGLMRGAIGGAIATPVALGSFYVAHTDDLGQTVNGMDAWLGVGLAVGLVAGGIGGAVRRLLGHFHQPKWWKLESSD